MGEPPRTDLPHGLLPQSAGLTIACATAHPPAQDVLQMLPTPVPPALRGRIEELRRPAMVVGSTPCAIFASECLSRPDVAYLIVVNDPRDVSAEMREKADAVLVAPASLDDLVRAAAETIAVKQANTPPPVAVVDATGLAWEGRFVRLPVLETRILRRLLQAHGNVVSRQDLAREIWDYLAEDDHSRAVDTHIYRLRHRLNCLPSLSIETIRQRGYRLTLPARKAG